VVADSRSINAHYGRPGLGDLILDGMRAAGKDPDRISPDDLAPVDQFHIRGQEATLELAGLAGLRAGQQVLDVGGGLGGPARTLAAELGCRVTVLDLTEEYCRVGASLTARTGLQDRVCFQHGSALEMPFPDASFDVVWTQHSTMNIAPKERLYTEIYRVLRPGGRLAMHEIVAGPVQPIHFPVPWAPDAAISFLQSYGEIRSMLKRAGFTELAWMDVSRPSLEWFRERVAAMSAAGVAAPPPLGLHLLLGPLFGPAFQNQICNLEEDRIAVLEAVLER
jgi:ubiquinone/menaquinone biosynthesis C-methylase UbiE